MVKIKVNKDFSNISIYGHALYNDYGNDIVCASISTIIITTIRAILLIEEKSIEYIAEEGNVNIKVINKNEIVNKLISNMLSLLKELSGKYPKNIKFI